MDPSFDIRLHRHAIWRLVAALACLNVVFLAATWLRATLGPSDDLAGYALRQLDIRTEQSVAAWYSGLLLLAAAGAFGLAFLSGRLAPGRQTDRLLDWGWPVIALLFAGLSFDEVAGIHEATPQAARNPFEGRLDDWVGVLAVPIAAVVIALAAFAWVQLRRATGPFALFALGLLLLATVPGQEQLQNWMRVQYGGRSVLFALLEEGAEVFGAVAFLAAGLLHALGPGETLRVCVVVPVRTAATLAAAVPIALACGVLAVEAGLPALGVRLVGGTPSGWFGGVGALLAGAAAFVIWRRRRGAPDGAAWLAVGLVALLVATDLGTGRALTEQLWPASPRRQLAVRAVLGTSALVAAGTVWLRADGDVRRGVRSAGLFWGLAAAAAIAALPGSTWLLLAATGAMLGASVADRGRAAPAPTGRAALVHRPVPRSPLER